MISSFFRNRLIARKHSLCIVKSRESMVLFQYNCAWSASRAFKAVRCSIELACDVKAVPTMTQNRRISSLHKYLDGNPKLRPCDSTKLSVSDKTYSERFRICLIVSLRALPKRSRVSEKKQSLIFDRGF